MLRRCLRLFLQYNIKKKVVEETAMPVEPDNPLMRKKKTPEELAREAELADQDEFTSKSPAAAALMSASCGDPAHAACLDRSYMRLHAARG